MHLVRRRLRPVTWFALVAIWALALLPAVSHALEWSRGTGSVLVCTAQGARFVAAAAVADAAADKLPVTGKLPGHEGHCPYCSLGTDATPVPAAPAVAAFIAPERPVALPRDDAAPRPATAWTPAAPRAPPARA